jgi:hypothetical protein
VQHLFQCRGKDIVALARFPEHLLEICDVVLRLLATSVVHSVRICNLGSSPNGSFINAPTLANMMEQCQSLKALELAYLEMHENHCHALGAYSRPDLEIELTGCAIVGAGIRALAEVLGRNQGPTKIDDDEFRNIDYSVLADGLRGNSRLKSLRPRISSKEEDGNRQVLAIAGALRENKGLVELYLSCFMYGPRTISVSDETWGAICDSLETHPTLEVLDLSAVFNDATTTAAVVKFRVQAILDMMKMNTSIHTMRLHNRYIQHENFRESVIPYLETNRLRPRLLAIQKTRPIRYRAKVLGRALLSARTDANSFWMLLSGNAEVVFPSRTTTIAAAVDLPPPAAATPTSTANVAAVATSVMSALPTTATVSLPAAAAAATLSTASDAFAPAATANVSTPSARQKRNSARQKRKAHP